MSATRITGKRATVVAAAIGLAAGPVLAVSMTSTAEAVDGSVSSRFVAIGGGGSTAKAYVDFRGSKNVAWKSIYVNDTCPGDGKRASLKFMVRYEGSTGWTTVGTRTDRGGCKSAPYKESVATWGPTNKRINDATVVACVQGRGCASPNSSYRDNPYW